MFVHTCCCIFNLYWVVYHKIRKRIPNPYQNAFEKFRTEKEKGIFLLLPSLALGQLGLAFPVAQPKAHSLPHPFPLSPARRPSLPAQQASQPTHLPSILSFLGLAQATAHADAPRSVPLLARSHALSRWWPRPACQPHCHTHLSTKWNAYPYVRPEINHT
jgi:hypothetical protein